MKELKRFFVSEISELVSPAVYTQIFTDDDALVEERNVHLIESANWREVEEDEYQTAVDTFAQANLEYEQNIEAARQAAEQQRIDDLQNVVEFMTNSSMPEEVVAGFERLLAS